jgi:hypothetical protein
MLRVTAGHDIEYPLKGAGTAVGYYLQDGLEPPGVWAGKAAEAMGLSGRADPEVYRALFGKLVAPAGNGFTAADRPGTSPAPRARTRRRRRRLRRWRSS